MMRYRIGCVGMKFKYSIPKNNLFKYYNESMAILSKRKIIEKYDGCIMYNFLLKNVLRTIFVLIILICFDLFIWFEGIKLDVFNISWNVFVILFLILQFIVLFDFLIKYNKLKKSVMTGIFIIDNENIIDKDEKLQLGFKLNDIKAIVVGKYCVMIIFNEVSVGFRLPVSYSGKIIDAIKKYKEDVKIVKLFVE